MRLSKLTHRLVLRKRRGQAKRSGDSEGLLALSVDMNVAFSRRWQSASASRESMGGGKGVSDWGGGGERVSCAIPLTPSEFASETNYGRVCRRTAAAAAATTITEQANDDDDDVRRDFVFRYWYGIFSECSKLWNSDMFRNGETIAFVGWFSGHIVGVPSNTHDYIHFLLFLPQLF